MLAPIRDHLSPKDPASSALLCSAKDYYFSRLSVDVQPGGPGFGGAGWVMSEDVNVEHLLDVFTTVDGKSGAVWGACVHFIEHLTWHKPRLVMLGPKIEALADDHPSKLECLFRLSELFQMVGNYAERKRLLTYALALSREQEDVRQLARTLRQLSDVHLRMGLVKEGIQQAKGASEIYKWLGDTVDQAQCIIALAWLLHNDGQLDNAEEAISRAIVLLPERGEEFLVCRCHHLLGVIYSSRGTVGEAVHHLEVALEIATPFSWLDILFGIRHSMALLFSDEGRFDDAHAHVEQAKLHATNGKNAPLLAHAMQLQAEVLCRQHRFAEAKSEVLGAVEIFEKLGAINKAESARRLLQRIERDS